MYIGDYAGRRAIYSPDQTAIIDTGKTPALRLSFRQVNERANRLAGWLRQTAHVEQGARVAILARDGVEHLDCFFACGKLGAIHTPLNWRLHPRELAQLVGKSTPRAVLFADEFRDAVMQIRHAVRASEHSRYVHIDGNGIAGSKGYDQLLAETPAERVSCESLQAEDSACLLFTGGTTGLPKGAQISHRMICWNALNTITHDLVRGDIYLCVFPLFHAGGLFAYLSSQIILGNTTVLTRQFDPAQVLEVIERERITVFAGVPTMYQALVHAPNWERADLSSLRFCTSGGAPLPVPLIEQYAREKNVRFKQGFGMTEFGPGLFALAPEDAIRKAGSIGRPNFFVDVRVVGEDNRPLGPHEVGELVLKGPSGCSGYFEDPAASASSVDSEGWFHTGDLVYYDDEWYFYVTDRKKDMFISGGENVYPVEVEAALYQHPAVQMCAVIGLADRKWGQVGKAFVVLKPNAVTTPEELTAYLKDNLASYKVPKSIELMDSLPLSGMGKILKSVLRERFSR